MTALRLSSEHVAWREIEGAVVAIDTCSSTYLAPDTSGSVLWRALAAGATRDELVDTLVDRFGIDLARAEEDVDRFVGELARRGLLAG